MVVQHKSRAVCTRVGFKPELLQCVPKHLAVYEGLNSIT